MASKTMLNQLLKGRVALVTGEHRGCPWPPGTPAAPDGPDQGLGMSGGAAMAAPRVQLPACLPPPPPLTARPPPARARTPAGSTTGIGAGILKQLAAGGATTVMHGLVSEAEITAKAAAVQEQYGLPCGTSTADLLDPQAIR
jgi:hypothetical protein